MLIRRADTPRVVAMRQFYNSSQSFQLGPVMNTPAWLRPAFRALARWRRQRKQEAARRQTIGWRSEDAAARLLRKLGFHIVGRNVRLPGGEIDIIAVDDRTVVFVEVKGRLGDAAGRPEDHVDDEKQRRLSRLATIYLRRRRLQEYRCRFDVVAVYWRVNDNKPELKHYRNAFQSAI